MSRASQFISYINEEKEPDPIDKLTKYTDLTITKEVQKERKKYKKNIKEEKK